MKYIIMCGGGRIGEIPKQMYRVNGEEIVERTIRLLRAEGVEDIAISTMDTVFEKYKVPLLEHDKTYFNRSGRKYWVDGFYPTDEPATYLFGDVYFSPEAIHKIVTTDTNDIEFFASAPPFAREYPKPWAEPFAFKVVNQQHFRKAIADVKCLCDSGSYTRHPIAWELWGMIKGTLINHIDYRSYTAINDYTCDVDQEGDVKQWRIKR